MNPLRVALAGINRLYLARERALELFAGYCTRFGWPVDHIEVQQVEDTPARAVQTHTLIGAEGKRLACTRLIRQGLVYHLEAEILAPELLPVELRPS